jgi:hypothetical protein
LLLEGRLVPGAGFLAQIAYLAGCGLVGGFTFFLIARLLGVDELRGLGRRISAWRKDRKEG